MVKKSERLEIRLTKKEKEIITNKAKENKSTISALIINSIKNNVTVELDTSDYRDLVIQVRRIGNNINSVLRNINQKNYYTEYDFKNIERELIEINNELDKEKTKIDNQKKYLENRKPKSIKRILEKREKEIPMYLIMEDILDQLNRTLYSFIDLTEENLGEEYRPYIDLFIQEFSEEDFKYDELIKLSNELNNEMYKTNQRLLTKNFEFSEEDFLEIMEILNKYRKKSD